MLRPVALRHRLTAVLPFRGCSGMLVESLCRFVLGFPSWSMVAVNTPNLGRGSSSVKSARRFFRDFPTIRLRRKNRARRAKPRRPKDHGNRRIRAPGFAPAPAGAVRRAGGNNVPKQSRARRYSRCKRSHWVVSDKNRLLRITLRARLGKCESRTVFFLLLLA